MASNSDATSTAAPSASTAPLPPSTAVPPVADLTSPFYIHPNENPTLVLVSPPLDGSNYHSWARAMRMALLSKNKLRFVDGSLPPPPSNASSFPIWKRCNNLVQGWLNWSLSPSISKSVLWFDSAAEIWTDLHSRFAQSDLFRIADLQEEIYNLQQGSSSVSDYFTSLKILWDEMSNIRPLKPCTCGSIGNSLLHCEEDQVIRFLKGLNEPYASIKSQIMLLDPLPPITRVFSLVVQHERELHLPVVPVSSTNSAVLMTKAPHFASSGSKSKLCTYCGKPCHTEDTCYRKHGFPPGFKFWSSANTVNNISTQGSGSGLVQSPSAMASSPTLSSSTAAILPQL
ncbi:hypothetical protein QN277_004893 [Acacia crassicarpa]|uniref:Retrotransposon Copia-like N-terminal domain-containing protein n=1 Tax=Acacia crassicarpa TaxID=499986 RepID=A0AAE1M990_9FABA|nr:hypothetical protein QN277_004893 [Acacia crassicarpa]